MEFHFKDVEHFMEFRGITFHSMELHGGYMEPARVIPWNPMEFHYGMSWS